MKEAAGEANMTVITIILIGVIAAIAIPLVNSAMKNGAKRGCCQSAGGYMQGSNCVGNNGVINESEYWDSNNNTCVVK